MWTSVQTVISGIFVSPAKTEHPGLFGILFDPQTFLYSQSSSFSCSFPGQPLYSPLKILKSDQLSDEHGLLPVSEQECRERVYSKRSRKLQIRPEGSLRAAVLEMPAKGSRINPCFLGDGHKFLRESGLPRLHDGGKL